MRSLPFPLGQAAVFIRRVMLGLVVTFFAVSIALADPPSADDVNQLMENQPLTDETWPQWRDYYTRLYFAYDVAEPDEFYDQIREFIGGKAAQNNGDLPEELASDPVAWIVLASPPYARGPAGRGGIGGLPTSR